MNMVYDQIQGLLSPKLAFVQCSSVIVNGAIILQARNLEIALDILVSYTHYLVLPANLPTAYLLALSTSFQNP